MLIPSGLKFSIWETTPHPMQSSGTFGRRSLDLEFRKPSFRTTVPSSCQQSLINSVLEMESGTLLLASTIHAQMEKLNVLSERLKRLWEKFVEMTMLISVLFC